MQAFYPETEAEAADVVRAALSENQAIQVSGSGSKQGWGRPVAADVDLHLSALQGIESYEPEELVLTAKAGTAMAEIERALAQKNQTLAFEPPDLGPLYGGGAGSGTLGGIIACNLSGPARIRSGAARDHVLGLDAIGGRGEMFHSGGRVVKNVTGFDLSKVMAGSFGTLGLLFTPAAMIIAQTLLVFPIVASLSRQASETLWDDYADQLRSFGASRGRMVSTILWDGRVPLATAVLAGFGRASAEVGAVMIVGGNIDHVTRVMTTSIALETSKGELGLALALGFILITISLAISTATYWLSSAFHTKAVP